MSSVKEEMSWSIYIIFILNKNIVSYKTVILRMHRSFIEFYIKMGISDSDPKLLILPIAKTFAYK